MESSDRSLKPETTPQQRGDDWRSLRNASQSRGRCTRIGTSSFIPGIRLHARIEPGSQQIILQPTYPWVRRFRWDVQVGRGACGTQLARDDDVVLKRLRYTHSVNESLGSNPGLIRRLLSVRPVSPQVETVLHTRSWAISKRNPEEPTEWNRQSWDCYQAIARFLLTMPFPDEL